MKQDILHLQDIIKTQLKTHIVKSLPYRYQYIGNIIVGTSFVYDVSDI